MQNAVKFGSAGPISVVKFGGSSFVTPWDYQKIARFLQQEIAAGNRLVVVVSAMSGTTGRLAELLDEVAPNHSLQDRDAVLGTGEILAVALVRSALENIGIQAVSLNGFQLGWTASDCFADGTLTKVPADALLDSLKNVPVCVVSGGQALTSGNRLVMLGRNSSDLSAIAVAMALKISKVTIFPDVEGVCTADPYLIKGTRLIPELCFEFATKFSKAGAKILYSKCIELAQKHQIEIQCAALTKDNEVVLGTRISKVGNGVQVCLPKSHIVIQIPKNELENIDTNGLYSVLGQKDLYVVDEKAPILAKISPNYKILSNTLSPIICFSKDGVHSAFAVLNSQQREIAQKLHDKLLCGTKLPKRLMALEKKRGSHTDIFEQGSVG